MRYGWLALPISLLSMSEAAARESRYRIDVPAGTLASALATLSGQADLSFGIDGNLPRISVSSVRGTMSAREAIRRLLRGSKLTAVMVAPRTFRLIPQAPIATPNLDPTEADIVISARKRTESAAMVPGSVAVFVPARSHRTGAVTDSHAVSEAIDGVSLTSLGPGRDRPFLRGVADSPFNGFTQTTVAIQFDDGRITYDAAEPGLRLVDVERVEVLKGPQGPLYGTGALGGIYRVVTNRAAPSAVSAMAAAGVTAPASGGLGGEAEAMLNLPLSADRAALRLVGYTATEPGWINTSDRENINRSQVMGGRVAMRVLPGAQWVIDLAGAGQRTKTRDSQYVDRDVDDLTRLNAIQEPRNGRFFFAQVTASGPVSGVLATIATSQAWQDQDDLFDASASAAALGVAAPTTYRDRRSYRVFDQEIRIGSMPDDHFVWTAGLSYLSATTRASGDLSGAQSNPFFILNRAVVETAAYADISVPVTSRFKVALGTRAFRTTIDDERDTAADRRGASRALIGVTPSGSLSYAFSPTSLVYVRYGTAFRPGGIDPTNSITGRYDADEVGTVDLGSRIRAIHDRLAIDINLYRSSWHDVQSDYLETDGIVATRNAGNALILGGEIAVDWRLATWHLRSGFNIQRARLVSAPDGTDLIGDLRLPIAPDVSGRAEVVRTFGWHDWRLSPFLAATIRGATRLSFDPGLDRRTPAYAIWRAGIEIFRESLTVRLGIENLLDARVDTFAFGNPFSIRTDRHFTPSRPRTLRIGVSRNF